MKTKKFSKQLRLNKETIVHLDDDKLMEIQGGISTRPCAEQTLLGCPTQLASCTSCPAPC
jgi:hypothetical protein